MASNNLNLGYDPSRKNLGYDPVPSVTKKDDEEWGYFDRLKFNLTKPIRDLIYTSTYVTAKTQNAINKKNGTETATPKKTINVFSPVPSYTAAQFDENSNINKTAETLYDATKETGKNVVKAGKDFVKNPGQSIKSIGVGTAEGIDGGIDTITDAKNDFLDFITFGTYKKSNPMYIRSEMNKDNPYSLQNQYQKTETYQDKKSGNLSEEQQNIYQVGQNIGNMIPSIAVSTVAGPTAGSAVFFVQSQQSYTEEAKKRGYSDIEARTYGLVMGGAEVIVERMGFDELGGLNKLSKGSVLKSMGGEALEEFVMPYIDSTVKTAYGEDVNWNDTIYESVESAVYGAVIGGLMNLGGKGLSKVDIVVNKINNNQTVTSEEMAAALAEVKDSNPEYFNEIIAGLDQQTIAEIEQKMNVQQKTAETKVPTVQEVVAQENKKRDSIPGLQLSNNTNSKMLNEPTKLIHDNNILHHTSETVNNNIPSTSIDNNIAQSNESVKFKNFGNLQNNLDNVITEKKGNIPINTEVLNKYSTVREIFDNELNNFNGEVKIGSNLKEFENINLEQISITESKKIADDIFKKYNTTSEFINNGNKIVVNKSGINESVEKIFNNRKQRNLLKQHLQVFSDLGDIIEKAKLVNQTQEHKGRKNIKLWNYYYNGLNIDGETYNLVFDVRSMENGENQYRVQRLERVIKKTGDYDGDVSNNTKILPPYSQPVSDNNIAQIDKNVKLPIVNTNNMQNNENNTNKVMDPLGISKMTPKDANTTPVLPPKKVSTGRGESKFAKNIENKTNMLTKENKYEILDSNEVKYYEEVTNKESLEKAFERLNKGGESEVMNWLKKDSSKATSVDVAEGWILLKQYQDKIAKTNDISTKDDLNRSMVEVAKKMREIGTKAGQTVQAYNILNRLTPEGMVYYAQSELSEAFDTMSKNKTKEWIDSNREKFNLTPQETEFIMKTMQEVQQMKDGYEKRVKLAEIQKVMTDKLPPSKGAGIKAWMRISMLFNPKTQVRNVMGNAIIAPVNTFSDLFASTIDKQIAKKTGVRTTGTTDVKSYLKGFKEGAYQSYNDFKKGINTRNIQGNRFEITEGKSFNDNNLIGKGLNRVDSLLSFMLDAGDRTFYEATFTNSINNQLKLNNTIEVTQDMIDIATSEALSRTWQDNNGYTRFVLNIRKGLNAINVKGYGLGDVLIPFAKTPANLTKAIIDYSPAGMIKTIIEGNNLRKSLTNGQYTAQMQHQFVQDLGKATAGTMLYVLGYALAKAGITTGESDDDKDVSNFMKNTMGVSSYSIKIGNKSFTYDWAQPIAAPFAITSNIVQKQKDNATLVENVISSLDTAGNILLEQSFLESISTVLNNNEGIATGIQEAIFELPSRAVPTLFKQIADLIDPVQRQTFEKDKPLETAVNKVKAKIPGLSKTLAPSVDTMGREIEKYGGKNNIFNVFLNPATVNTENISKSAEEIYRVYKETGDATIMPRVAPYYINQNGEKIILTSEQRAEYQKISGNIIENSIKELLNKSSYKKLSDEEKADIINKVVNYSYNKAREEVLGISMSNTYNKINQYIADGGKASNYYLNKEEIDYSYDNPEKYQVITQITTYDKYLTYQDEIDIIKEKYTNTIQRKTAVIKYVNSLNLSVPQKAMLIKLNYNSYDSYNKNIIQYINKQNLTKQEKTDILVKLGFTVRNGRVYS